MARGSMPGTIDSLEQVFKALADRTRLRILGLLVQGEVCVCDIHESLKIPQPRASRHLAYLRRVGLVRARKDGLWMHYGIVVPRDPVARTIVDAAIHGLGHLREAEKDAARLRDRTGARRSKAIVRPELPCCGGVAAGSCEPSSGSGPATGV